MLRSSLFGEVRSRTRRHASSSLATCTAPLPDGRFGSPGKLEAQIRLSISLDNSVYQRRLTEGVIRSMFAPDAELCSGTTIVTGVDHIPELTTTSAGAFRFGSEGVLTFQAHRIRPNALRLRRRLNVAGVCPRSACTRT